MKKNEVPFYCEMEGRDNCYEYVLKMILKHFLPEETYSLQKLEEITQKKKCKFSWSFNSYIYLTQKGFEIKNITLFDDDRFILEGSTYYRDYCGEDVYTMQDSNGLIEQGREMLKNMKEEIEKKPSLKILYTQVPNEPTLNDIKSLIDNNYLVDCTHDAKHSVLVYDYDDENIVYHDPAHPRGKAKKMSNEDFEAKWTNNYKVKRELTALRLKK